MKPLQAYVDTVPPKVPDDRAELERAVVLLGELVKHELRPSRLAELYELLGTCPDPDVALAWKNALKDLLRDDELWSAR